MSKVNEAPLADRLNAALDENKLVQVATAWRVVRVARKHRDAWRAAGHEFFRTGHDDHPEMIDGRVEGQPRYVSIIGCKVTVFG